MKGVQGTTEAREQLHRWMDEDRERLRITWADLARHMKMTEENLLRIRKGRISISLKAAKKIEEALQWPPAAVEAAVLRGVRPQVPVPDDQPSAFVDPATGTWGDLQRELSYFHGRLRDRPEDFERLNRVLDLYARLQDRPLSTQSSAEIDAHG